MNEAKKLLRYIFPGVLFLVEFLLLTLMVLPCWAENIVSFLTKDMSTALGGLMSAGALGYFFSVIHHLCHWSLPCDQNVINHSDNIDRLVVESLIPPTTSAATKKREAALDLTLLIWHSRLSTGHAIASADGKVSSLSDVAHSAGTARIASAFALVLALGAYLYNKYGVSDVSCYSMHSLAGVRLVLMLICGLTTVALFHMAYKRTGGIAQRLIDRLVEETLLAEKFRGSGLIPSLPTRETTKAPPPISPGATG